MSKSSSNMDGRYMTDRHMVIPVDSPRNNDLGFVPKHIPMFQFVPLKKDPKKYVEAKGKVMHQCPLCLYQTNKQLKGHFETCGKLIPLKRYVPRVLYTSGRDFRCAFCDFISKTLKGLARHYESHKDLIDRGLLKCPHCRESFFRQDRYDSHLLLHELEKVIKPDVADGNESRPSHIECVKIKEEISSDSEMDDDATATIRCGKCAYTCTNRSDAKIHRALEHPPDSNCYICPERDCTYRTSRQRRMQNHLLLNHEIVYIQEKVDLTVNILGYEEKGVSCLPLKLRLKCPFCPFLAETANKLLFHQEARHAKVTCNSCSKTFGGNFQMFVHNYLIHGHNSQYRLWRLRCVKCSYDGFLTDCYKHGVLHNEDVVSFEVMFVGITTTFVQFQYGKQGSVEESSKAGEIQKVDPDDRHLQKKPKRLSCKKCHFETEVRSLLTVHEYGHVTSIEKREKKFACAFCEYTLSHKSSMKYHVTTKHKLDEAAWFQLLEPQEDTPQQTTIKIEVGSLICDQCNSFTTDNQKELRLHTMFAHWPAFLSSENLFSCTFCDFKTNHKKSLRKHLRLEHQWTEDNAAGTAARETAKPPKVNRMQLAKKAKDCFNRLRTAETNVIRAKKVRPRNKNRKYCCPHLDCHYLNYDQLQVVKHVLQEHRVSEFSVAKYLCPDENCIFDTIKRSNLEKHLLEFHMMTPKEIVDQNEAICNLQFIGCTLCKFRSKKIGDFKKHFFKKHAPPNTEEYYQQRLSKLTSWSLQCVQCGFRTASKKTACRHCFKHYQISGNSSVSFYKCHNRRILCLKKLSCKPTNDKERIYTIATEDIDLLQFSDVEEEDVGPKKILKRIPVNGFACKSCRFASKEKHVIKLHEQLSHRQEKYSHENPYWCPLCSARIVHRLNFRRHMRNRHKMSVKEVQKLTKPVYESDDEALEGIEFMNVSTEDVEEDLSDTAPIEIIQVLEDNVPAKGSRVTTQSSHKKPALSNKAKLEDVEVIADGDELICDQCGYTTVTDYMMTVHIQLIHRDDMGSHENPYVCPLCSAEILRRYNLRKHFITQHRITLPRKEDLLGPNYVPTKRTMEYVQLPDGIVPNNSSSESPLVEIKTETLEGHIQCPYQNCNFTCSDVVSIAKHVKTCGKSQNNSQLKPNEDDPLDSDVFFCDKCNYVTKTHYLLGVHDLLAHRQDMGSREQPYVCPLCFACISRRFNLRKHFSKMHKITLPSKWELVWTNYESNKKIPEITDVPKMPSLKKSDQPQQRKERKRKFPRRIAIPDDSDDENLACHRCNYVADEKYLLKMHQQLQHKREKRSHDQPYVCPLCSACVAYRCNFRRHFHMKHNMDMEQLDKIIEKQYDSDYEGSSSDIETIDDDSSDLDMDAVLADLLDSETIQMDVVDEDNSGANYCTLRIKCKKRNCEFTCSDVKSIARHLKTCHKRRKKSSKRKKRKLDAISGKISYKCSLCNESLFLHNTMHSHTYLHAREEDNFDMEISFDQFKGATKLDTITIKADKNFVPRPTSNVKVDKVKVRPDSPKDYDPDLTVFSCYECNFKSNEEFMLTRHKKLHWNAEKEAAFQAQKWFTCGVCYFYCLDVQTFKEHGEIHSLRPSATVNPKQSGVNSWSF